MNPPVEAPQSRHVRLVGLMLNCLRAPSSLSPPRPTNFGFSRMLRLASESILVLGLGILVVPVMTSPARMSRFACSRESHSPRAMSRASARSFGILFITW